MRYLLLLIIMNSFWEARSQEFIFSQDSISIYGHKIPRHDRIKPQPDNNYLVKNISKFIPYKYKKGKDFGFTYRVFYKYICVSFITSNILDHPFYNTELYQIRFDYYNMPIEMASSVSIFGHIITDSMDFNNFIKDDFWKSFADKTCFEKYKHNNVIYVDCKLFSHDMLFEFENKPPYKIRKLLIEL